MRNRPETLTNLQSLIEQEQTLTDEAAERLGNIVQITEYGLGILSTAIESIRKDNELIAGIQLAIQKSATLAYLAYCRSHAAQAEFNCRQMIEYTCIGSYYVAHPEAKTHRTGEDGNVELIPNQTINGMVNPWMAQTIPEISAALKGIKNDLNQSVLHGCLYGTTLTMSYEEAADQYNGSFFDNVAPDCYRAWLLRLCEIIALSLAAMRAANREHGAIIYREDEGSRYAAFVHYIATYREGFATYLNAGRAAL